MQIHFGYSNIKYQNRSSLVMYQKTPQRQHIAMKLPKQRLATHYMTALYISYCFHAVLKTYKVPYNTTVSLYKANKFVGSVEERSKKDIRTQLIGTQYFSRICTALAAETNESILPRDKLCCRRLWLACLIIASKYNNDCNYSMSIWSKWTGLPTEEINEYERLVLKLLNYQLYISCNEIQELQLNIHLNAEASHLKIIKISKAFQARQAKHHSKTHLQTPPASPSSETNVKQTPKLETYFPDFSQSPIDYH